MKLTRRHLPGIILIYFCACAAFVAAQSTTLEQDFQAAMAAQDAGDLDKAESILTALHARHPGNFAIDESLGLVYGARGKFALALPVLEAAAREAPESDVAHANLGAAYYQLHRNDEALKAFERAAQLNPKNAATEQALGQIWMDKHEPGNAAEAFGAALALKPGDGDLMLARAQALVDAGRAQEAKAQLAQVPDGDHVAGVQELLGDVEEKAGDVRAAAEHYARAVELDPSEPNVWALGVEFLRHWTFEPAIKEFEAAIVKFPQSARMKMGLGLAVYGNGDFPRAIGIFSDLLATDGKNALYAQMLGAACSTVAEGEQPKCAALVPYAQAHPREADVAVHTAAWLLKQAHTPERANVARGLLGQAIAVNPHLAEAQYLMGLMDQDEGHWPESIPRLEEAVRLDAGLSEAHYRLGQAYWHAGRKQDADAQMELYKKSREKNLEERDRRLSQITTLIVDMGR